MANFLLLDFFNLVKRYTFLLDSAKEDGEFYSNVSIRVINKIMHTVAEHKIDFLVVCSDLGFNARANAVLGGSYKANRGRSRSLTQEEREKDYIENLKGLVKSMPCTFIEVKDVEADNIVYFTVNYLKKHVENSKFFIATTDTDFLQLLDDNVSIINWNKGLVTAENWKEVHEFDCEYLKPKDYALLKSMVGDPTDNIKGIKGFGWKTVLKLLTFLYKKLDKNLTLDNIESVLAYIKDIRENHINVKKEITLCDKMLSLIEENKEDIVKNYSIVSLEMLETPHITRIMSSLEASLKEKISFDSKEFINRLRFKERFSNDVDYDRIINKNIKLIYSIKKFASKAEKLRQQIAGQ